MEDVQSEKDASDARVQRGELCRYRWGRYCRTYTKYMVPVPELRSQASVSQRMLVRETYRRGRGRPIAQAS